MLVRIYVANSETMRTFKFSHVLTRSGHTFDLKKESLNNILTFSKLPKCVCNLKSSLTLNYSTQPNSFITGKSTLVLI